MPKFYVTVTETATYRVCVEAPDRRSAGRCGVSTVADGIGVAGGWNVNINDREIIHIMPAPQDETVHAEYDEGDDDWSEYDMPENEETDKDKAHRRIRESVEQDYRD